MAPLTISGEGKKPNRGTKFHFILWRVNPMFRVMMNGKIHRATVTEANLNYVGSITIDEDILDAVGMVANEKVQIVNNNNGARLETYIIPGERGTGTICLNGAAARLVQVGDIVIIISYCYISNEELHSHQPKVAIMDEHNRIINILHQEPVKTVM
jgi:aspartate 1-decarboxylase